MTSCLTTTINILNYEEYEVKSKHNNEEIIKILLEQVNEMSTHIDDLTDQVIRADGKRVIVHDLRDDK
jgi:flagellar hook-associated protein FlgK